MARRFSVSFDLEFTEEVDASVVSILINELLDEGEFDHTDVEVIMLDLGVEDA